MTVRGVTQVIRTQSTAAVAGPFPLNKAVMASRNNVSPDSTTQVSPVDGRNSKTAIFPPADARCPQHTQSNKWFAQTETIWHDTVHRFHGTMKKRLDCWRCRSRGRVPAPQDKPVRCDAPVPV